MLVIYVLAINMLKLQNHITKTIFLDVYVIIIFSSILGGRFAHVLFYEFEYFRNNPYDILYLHKGGMSSFGAFFLSCISIYLYSKKIKINFFIISDFVFLFAPISIFFIRISNFLNNEISTKVQYNFYISLYESIIEGLILFIILFIIFLKKYKISTITFTFIFIYSIERIIIEFFKQEKMINIFFIDINISQVLYFILFITSILVQKIYNKSILMK
jgi:phosphatidylglycerol:prolipoprotein diacylglycerol transferase